MLLLFPSCTEKKRPLAAAILQRDSLPMMKTLEVSTLISDSGITRYRITTKEWTIFDRKKPPYWAFSSWHMDAHSSVEKADEKVEALSSFSIGGQSR